MTCVLPYRLSSIESIPELKILAWDCLYNSSEPKYTEDFIGRKSYDEYENGSTHKYTVTMNPSLLSEMKHEAKRLESYGNRWPLNFIQPADLATVGLFYTGVNDIVQCAFCGGVIMDWNEGDEPLREHATHFPLCPFLLNSEVGNVPISGSNGSQKWLVKDSHAECSDVNRRQNSIHTRLSYDVCGTTINDSDAKGLYPDFENFDKRLETFHSWPSAIMQPRDLAEAGLFYSGESDVVTCFSCGGCMASWNSGDEAWTEHAKHFPNCNFIRCTKGSSFIQNIRQRENESLHNTSDETSACCNSLENPSSSTSNEDTSSLITMMSELTSREDNEPETVQITKDIASRSNAHTDYMCKICMDQGTRVAFIPCGHSLACPKCAALLSRCPVCRTKITSTMRIYFD